MGSARKFLTPKCAVSAAALTGASSSSVCTACLSGTYRSSTGECIRLSRCAFLEWILLLLAVLYANVGTYANVWDHAGTAKGLRRTVDWSDYSPHIAYTYLFRSTEAAAVFACYGAYPTGASSAAACIACSAGLYSGSTGECIRMHRFLVASQQIAGSILKVTLKKRGMAICKGHA